MRWRAAHPTRCRASLGWVIPPRWRAGVRRVGSRSDPTAARGTRTGIANRSAPCPCPAGRCAATPGRRRPAPRAHEVHRVDAGQVEARDLAGTRCASQSFTAGRGQLRPQPRQPLGPARDHADVGEVALVAAAGPGERASSGTSTMSAAAAARVEAAGGSAARHRRPAPAGTAHCTHVRLAIEHAAPARLLVEQEGELPDHRRHRGPAAGAGRARRPDGAGRRDLAREHSSAAFCGCFATTRSTTSRTSPRPRMRAVVATSEPSTSMCVRRERRQAALRAAARAVRSRIASPVRRAFFAASMPTIVSCPVQRKPSS